MKRGSDGMQDRQRCVTMGWTCVGVLAATLHLTPTPAVALDGTGSLDLTAADSAAGLPLSLRHEAEAAAGRAAHWLERHQRDDGSWSNPDFPALTALPVWALTLCGRAETAAVSNGVDFILACARPDGAICREPAEQHKGGGLSNYNTALCMTALHLTGRPELDPVVARARSFVAGGQHLGNDEYRGGMGYDPETGRAYADLSNSYIAYEAMRLTEQIEDLRAASDADLDWDAALGFVTRLQQPDGGFIYKPGHSMAGASTNELGEVRFRSYGSMTYAGLLSMIYAGLEPSDPRVESALDWAQAHWTLEENPGTGTQGLYYFYNVLAKGLAASGHDTLRLPDGNALNWRDELIRKLVGLQKIDPATGDGYWVNDEGRWWEQDPVLVTSYALIALEVARGNAE